ncbi:MAG: peptidase, partial [Gemmatimonadota bacterium]
MFSHRTPWLLSVPLFALASGCGGAGNGESGGEGEVPENAAQREAAAYLAEYADTYQGLYYTANKADWAVNTRIVDGDTTNAARYRRAREALAAFEGSVDNIERIRGLLDERDQLAPLQTLQLEAMLFNAAQYPAMVPELVSERIAAETEQVETLYGFEFTLNGDPITPNRIDELLRTSSDLAERRSVWEASKEVGPALKEGIVELR